MLYDKLELIFDGRLAGKTIALWGLAFKPNTDDMRDAPSRALMERLWAAGARVQAFDPEAMDVARRLYGDRPDLVLAARPEDAVSRRRRAGDLHGMEAVQDRRLRFPESGA